MRSASAPSERGCRSRVTTTFTVVTIGHDQIIDPSTIVNPTHACWVKSRERVPQLFQNFENVGTPALMEPTLKPGDPTPP
jgi:hypothetical protein